MLVRWSCPRTVLPCVACSRSPSNRIAPYQNEEFACAEWRRKAALLGLGELGRERADPLVCALKKASRGTPSSAAALKNGHRLTHESTTGPMDDPCGRFARGISASRSLAGSTCQSLERPCSEKLQNVEFSGMARIRTQRGRFLRGPERPREKRRPLRSGDPGFGTCRSSEAAAPYRTWACRPGGGGGGV